MFAPEQFQTRRRLDATTGSADNYSWSLADHILLAACEPRQLASEYLGAGEYRGAFSFFLGDALERSQGQLTYRDLMARTRALISSCLYDQAPQLEVTAPALLDCAFLGTALTDVPRTLTVSFDQKRGQWVLNAGALHGVKMVSPQETTVLALFSYDGPPLAASALSTAMGTARVIRMQPAESVVLLEMNGGEPAPSATPFRAVVLESPATRLPISLVGDESGVEPVRQGLRPHEGEYAALYVREASGGEQPRILLRAREGRYFIRRPEDDRLLVQPLTGYADSAWLAVRQLEQIARWYLTMDLVNDSGELPAGAFEILVEINGKLSPGPDHRLEYRFDQGKWQQPTFRLGVRNKSFRDLYCALVTLSDDWEISTGLFPAGVVFIPAGGVAWALDGRPVYASVPRELWERGVTEFGDRVLAIMSNKTFDARPLEQPALGLPRGADRGIAGTLRRSTLQRLLIQTGERSAWNAVPEEIDDWQTARTSFTVVRPLEAVEVPAAPGDRRPLLGGMEVASHLTFRGHVQLLTPGQAGDQAPRPLLPTDDPLAVMPFHPTPTRGSGPESQFLEITAENNPHTVTPDAPLRFPMGPALGSDEQLLAVEYDGEFWLPIGSSVRGPSGEAELEIRSLPNPTHYRPDVKRSVSGAYGAYLYKIGGKVFGYAPTTSRLARVVWDSGGSFTYDDDVASIRRQVQSARKLLLFVHGIFGATDTMLPSLRTGRPFDHGKPLSESYDLVLAFDYENMNTPISETARSLKAALAEVGLGADHGKLLDVVAHSMGGLVARWLIEREGGNRVVSRLVMMGTPSGGSPWPTAHSLATLGLTAALNAITVVPARIFQAMTGLLGSPDVTLAQMKAESTFLGDLIASPDPGVQYGVVVGNLSLSDDREGTWWQRAWERLSLRSLTREVADLAVFWKKPNDFAVTVESMKKLPAMRDPEPRVCELRCDHLRYFEAHESIRAMAELLA